MNEVNLEVTTIDNAKIQTKAIKLNQSKEVNELIAALCKAQGEFKPVKKDSSAHGAYSFNWASLSSIENSTKDALVKNGICSYFITEPDPRSDNKIIITYMLRKNNQFLSASLPLIHENSKSDNQAMGKAISYNRRYLKYMLLDLAADDNDIDNSQEQVKQPAYNQYKNG
jgi:hypothetical protein|tara:strand:+ start:1286 stop:1795 length:510 start_codon:yes stop_codon:yes gene_type:complete